LPKSFCVSLSSSRRVEKAGRPVEMIDQHTLYVDNFRGFSDVYVPISDVSFLVGENSSGKTSLLSILKLMSAERLLLENQFLADDVDLGTFQDIVSAHTANPNYFRIGMIRRSITSKGQMPMGMLVTYEQHEGLPRDVCFTCTYDTKEIALRRVGKEFHFRTRDQVVSANTDIKRLISKWTEDHERPSGDFKRLEFPFGPEHSLLFPLSMVAQMPSGKEQGRTGVLQPAVFPQLTWVAPVRTKPKRTYDGLRSGFSSEGTHTPYLIRKILDTESQAKRFRKAINLIGKESGLFERVDIKRFGADATAPFEVDIILDKKPFNLLNVGYGVSQALPVLVEIIWRRAESWFAIQQPEVHLHPRAQAALGDLIFTMATSERKKFLIETHSDFMIDRYRASFRGAKAKKPISQVLFFERKNGRNTVTSLAIGEHGELPISQPRSYRRFFIKEQLDLLSV
jgi:hypothetical protein